VAARATGFPARRATASAGPEKAAASPEIPENRGKFGKMKMIFKLTFEGNQTNRRLISFKVSGSSFQSRFFCNVAGLGRVDEKQPIETKSVESLKEIGRWLARFPLKVDPW
jgi:hypothetical protein